MLQGLRDWFKRRRDLRDFIAENFDDSASAAVLKDQVAVGREALSNGRSEEALKIWSKLRVQFATGLVTSKDALDFSLDLGRYDETEALIHHARRRVRGRAAVFAAASARVAHRRGDLEQALRRCEILRRTFPETSDGYLIAATCLDTLNRPDEAETIVGIGFKKLPSDVVIHERYANYAMQRRAWTEALQRWQELRSRFGYEIGPLGVARCLWEMGNFVEAEKILIEACEHYRTPWSFVEMARVSLAKGDLAEAVRRWQSVFRQFPTFAIAYTAGAEAARQAGLHDEEDNILSQAVTWLKDDLGAHLEYARCAQRRSNWVAAAERWALVRKRFPHCEEAHEQEVALQQE